MKKIGVNPKKWFYAFKKRINEGDRLRTVLAGAACEQWLNGELFMTVAEKLKCCPDLTVYPEWQKRDIVIFDLKSPAPNNIVAVIETKVVYKSYSEKKIRRYIRTLCNQLITDPPRGSNLIGLVVAVFAYWPTFKSTRITVSEFKRRVRGALDEQQTRLCAQGWKYTVDHSECLETLLPERDVPIGGAIAKTACFAQYFRLSR